MWLREEQSNIIIGILYREMDLKVKLSTLTKIFVVHIERRQSINLTIVNMTRPSYFSLAVLVDRQSAIENEAMLVDCSCHIKEHEQEIEYL